MGILDDLNRYNWKPKENDMARAGDIAKTYGLSWRNIPLMCDAPPYGNIFRHTYEKEETEAEMKERHKKELAKAKEEKIEADKREAERKAEEEKAVIECKENEILHLIKRDDVLDKIDDAINSMRDSQFNPDTSGLKKAYNLRLDEIAKVMKKLKK